MIQSLISAGPQTYRTLKSNPFFANIRINQKRIETKKKFEWKKVDRNWIKCDCLLVNEYRCRWKKNFREKKDLCISAFSFISISRVKVKQKFDFLPKKAQTNFKWRESIYLHITQTFFTWHNCGHITLVICDNEGKHCGK